MFKLILLFGRVACCCVPTFSRNNNKKDIYNNYEEYKKLVDNHRHHYRKLRLCCGNHILSWMVEFSCNHLHCNACIRNDFRKIGCNTHTHAIIINII